MERSMPLFTAVIDSEKQESTAISLVQESGDCESQLEKEKSLSDSQRDLLAEYRSHGSVTKIARDRSITKDQVRNRLVDIRNKLGMSKIHDMLTDEMRGNRGVTQGTITTASLLVLLESQSYRCALSGIELTPNNSSLDHKVPISKGGSHSIDNVQWVHESVNAAKGTMDVEYFVQLCRRVSQWSA